MAQSVTPFLMFQGQAAEAIRFYASLFPDAQIAELERYKGDEAATNTPGQIVLAGQRVMYFDSPVKHDFTFTPASSLFVVCESDDEIDRIYNALLEGGSALMPLGSYGFSRKFAWVNDRFGVSWQLSLD